jgi:3-isopropylmalate/(R)-2-methylmalate dehydratase small subunit
MDNRRFTRISGIAAPLAIPNIDTDQIISVARATLLPPGELGPYAFEKFATGADGQPDPNFILHQPPFDQASIILAGPNFGCGSSRETAVWALKGRGIRCVIAPSFGSIFFDNCFENGLLPVQLPPGVIELLAEDIREDPELTVDLESQTIAGSCRMTTFTVEPLRRIMMLEGLDPISLTMRHEEEIAAFQARDERLRPWLMDTRQRFGTGRIPADGGQA